MPACAPGDCIGLDFDNTLVDYGELFIVHAHRLGLLPDLAPLSKTRLRDRLRRLPDGERQWQRVQAEVYGPGLAQARPHAGVARFLERCARRGLRCAVVSHKTRHAAQAPQGTDLHQAARDWLHAQGFVGPGRAIASDRVFFEETRTAKVRRLALLGCRAMVDDLPEVFACPEFPPGVIQALFDPQGRQIEEFEGFQGFQGHVCASWDAVGRLLLGEPASGDREDGP